MWLVRRLTRGEIRLLVKVESIIGAVGEAEGALGKAEVVVEGAARAGNGWRIGAYWCGGGKGWGQGEGLGKGYCKGSEGTGSRVLSPPTLRR